MMTIRAVVFKENGTWVAQCLEYNLASSGDTKDELVENLLDQINALFELHPSEPFKGFSPAPERYFRLFAETVSRGKAESLRPSLGQRLLGMLSGRPQPQVLAAIQ